MPPRVAIAYPASGGNPTKHDLFGSLSWATVTLLDPEREHPGLADRDFDLYHMARRTPATLADLERADSGGVPTVNPARGARLTSDRLARYELLSEAVLSDSLFDTEFAVPELQYGSADEIDLEPPVVCKSRYEEGWDTHILTVVREEPIEFDGERVVERFVAHDRTLKLYRVGEAVRAAEVRGGELAGHAPDAARPTYAEVSVPDRFERLVERIADATGLRLFETDVLVGDRDWVIDVNPVVSVRGIADGKEIYERLLRQRAGVGDSGSRG